MMRRLLVGLASVAALLAAPPAGGGTVAVNVNRSSFSPSSITVTELDSVIWTNRDSRNHQVVADDGSFASPILGPGKSYTFTFQRAGSFRYHDGVGGTARGTVTVKQLPAAVSLAASAPSVVYGGEVMLTGTISPARAGESVAVFAQPFGQAAPTQLTTVTTGDGGSWSLTVKPSIQTVYVVHYRTAASGTATVGVAPRLQFSTHVAASGRRFFFTRVDAGHSLAGKVVQLQRLSSFAQWVTVRTLVLGRASGRLFSYPLPLGLSRLRIALSVNQAGPGYLAGFSGSLAVRRR